MARSTMSAREAAEAAFRKTTAKPVETAPVRKAAAIPAGREQVTLRIDRDVLEHFQADRPGWQDRLNAALRRTTGLA